MNYLDSILLLGIDRLNGERTTSGLYHLFNGKKSSQTIQDGRLFDLSHLFGILKRYSYHDFQEKMTELHNNGLIETDDGTYARLSESGRIKLHEQLERQPLPPFLNGWRYGDLSIIFWRRLTLFVQTLSHILHEDHQFHPIQNDPDTLQWVKHFFPRDKKSRTKASSLLFKELMTLLCRMEDTDAENVVLRLTRSGRIGQTTLQVAERLKFDPMVCHVRFQAALHFMVDRILEGQKSYPVLYAFLADMKQSHALTESTRKTYQLINKGLQLEEVATIRKLKPSTIEDHIVELAIHVPGMDIDRYIPAADQMRILEVSRILRTKRLKEIKQELDEAFDYFQIRLTLAKHAVGHPHNKGGIGIVD
ncbi:helix-turn-helix domain-containing protein [Pseudalkalibacillus sp. A8]|uniref:helix-turn-helix domain-containing protein n=1 Tax=Pseudalkalibacillus sp. A8 TaxID=3382641 RepID=UPI0038B512DF